MKSPKTFEMMSHAHPRMRCPMCGQKAMESVTDYELPITTYSREEKVLTVHAVVCEECDYVAFSKETMIAVAQEGIGTAGKVFEKNGDVVTNVLH